MLDCNIKAIPVGLEIDKGNLYQHDMVEGVFPALGTRDTHVLLKPLCLQLMYVENTLSPNGLIP